MDLGLKSDLVTVADLRHRVRRLGWFRSSFRHAADLVGVETGLSFAIDDRALAAAFFGWIDAFTAQKAAAVDRRDFASFAAGLLLKELIRCRPARARLGPAPDAAREAAAPSSFWPEGFLYTQYCLAGLAAVLEQDFGEHLTLAAAADDIRTWWSFRENVAESPALAIPFLDQFVGGEPNWLLPEDLRARPMRRAAPPAALAH